MTVSALPLCRSLYRKALSRPLKCPTSRITTVSYTHLDVYKRQGFRHRAFHHTPEALHRGHASVGYGTGRGRGYALSLIHIFGTQDDVYICDPEAEYYPLVQRLHGQVVKLSPTSKSYVNPLDINLNYSEDESPLALKSDFVLSLDVYKRQAAHDVLQKQERQEIPQGRGIRQRPLGDRCV